MKRRLGALAAALAALVLALPLAAGSASAAEGDEARELFTMDDERITESSGLARSVDHEGIWWTTNDSSDSARIFAVNADGEVEAELTFGAEPIDVEAIAVGAGGTIYVADIGDNLSVRDKITVYAISEPDELYDQQVKYRAYDFVYPDGPHNAEALLVHPETSRLYIVTKEAGKGRIYAAPEEPSRRRLNQLTAIRDAPAIVTDATFTPNGKLVVFRDPVSMIAYNWPSVTKPQRAGLPLQPVGESLAMGPDDSTVLVGSEGRNSAVYEVPLPTPQTTPSPSPSPTPSPTASVRSAVDTGSGGSGSRDSHTMRWTLVGTGAFALVMAAVTFPRGRRERDDAVLEGQRSRSTT